MKQKFVEGFVAPGVGSVAPNAPGTLKEEKKEQGPAVTTISRNSPASSTQQILKNLPKMNFLTPQERIGMVSQSLRNPSYDLRYDILPDPITTLFNASSTDPRDVVKKGGLKMVQ